MLCHPLRLLRLKFGWTQEVLAARIGVPQVSLSRWERGYSKPRLAVIPRILAATGGAVTLTELLGIEVPGTATEGPRQDACSREEASRAGEGA